MANGHESSLHRERITFGFEEAIILDALGALAIKVEPQNEAAIVLDLEGRMNKSERRSQRRYLMAVGQVAELIASLVVAAHTAGGDVAAELERAFAREQARLGAQEAE